MNKSEKIHFEQICCIEKKNILFLLWKKYFGSQTVEKKFSGFLSEENLEAKKNAPPPLPENQMLGP